MEFRRLGRSGLQVSEMGLGASTFGEVVHGDEAVAVIQHAIASGITFIDTAVTYSGGESEETIGKAIKGRRHEVVLATKVGLRAGPGPYLNGLSRRRIMQAIEISLTRLGTDHVDLYQVHRPDPLTPFDETLEAMDRLVQAGKVRYVGGSSYTAWEMARNQGYAERKGLQPWISAQNRWNLVDGLDDPNLLDASRELGFGIIPFMPLASGVLTGKYHVGEAPRRGTRAGDLPRIREEVTDRRIRAVERLRPWAEARGHSTAELGLAWLLAYPECSTVIVSVRSKEQLDQNLRVAAWRLTADERDEARRIAVGDPPEGD